VPLRARALITEALAEGYDNAEVRFQLALAILSKRAYRDLTAGERDELAAISEAVPRFTDDEWRRGLEAICALLEYVRSRSGPELAQEKLLNLKAHQREKIEQHLDLVLDGVVKDSLWGAILRRAQEDQHCSQRADRVWAYFQAVPMEARARYAVKQELDPAEHARLVGWSALLALTTGYIGLSALTLGQVWPAVTVVAAVIAGYVAVSNAIDWRYRVERLWVRDFEHFGQPQQTTAPQGGFANKIDNSFAFYFAKYVPRGFEREYWLEATQGIRRTLRDEIVEIYRESRIPAERVNWLIRYLVGEQRKLWESGRQLDYRARYATPWSTKVLCIVASLVFIVATAASFAAAIHVDPIFMLLAAFGVGKSAWTTAPLWMHVIGERRRVKEENEDHDRILADRQAALERWRKKLDDARPTEGEMEYWLYCDTTVLLGTILAHYKLAWRDVMNQAFLQVPARHYKRARVTGGPWRFSKYDLRLFLITKDGVREISTELDFEHDRFGRQERTNYRFEAVSSVHVAEERDLSYTLQMTLSNGPARSIRITESAAFQLDPDDDPKEVSRINLDATGFDHTLHILEGIAAEGKEWIERGQFDDADPGYTP
jgi:hypothetical protein